MFSSSNSMGKQAFSSKKNKCCTESTNVGVAEGVSLFCAILGVVGLTKRLLLYPGHDVRELSCSQRRERRMNDVIQDMGQLKVVGKEMPLCVSTQKSFQKCESIRLKNCSIRRSKRALTPRSLITLDMERQCLRPGGACRCPFPQCVRCLVSS